MKDYFQFSIFNYNHQPLKITKPVRLIELFAGIGSQAKALERLGVDFEHYRVCEFDVHAIKSYNAIHGTNFETSDITKITAKDLGIVDTDLFIYLLTYSFPCQDLSLAGKQMGMAKGGNTRSSLLWEVERLLNECTELPQILLMENVTQVHGTDNEKHFNEWISFLEGKGYSNFWKDLNSKNFGIPQNRNRTFVVSILGDYTYEFPKEFPLELRLKDMLEDSVDEKFYISDTALKGFVDRAKKHKEKGNGFSASYKNGDEISNILTSRYYKDEKDCLVKEQPILIGGMQKNQTVDTMQGGNRQPLVVDEPQINVVGNYSPSGHDASRIVDVGGLAPTVKENHGTVTAVAECYVSEKGVKYICDPKRGMATDVNAQISQPLTAKGQSNWTGSFISPDIECLEKSSTIGGNEPTKINLKNGETVFFDGENFSSVEKTEQLLSDVKDGKYPQDTAYGKYLFQSSRFDDKPLEECSKTIKSTKVDCGVIYDLRIRKLTPKECWRLMGFDDADFEKAAKYNSNSQLYKQAGNSIVVDVLYYIFKQMI